MNLKTIRKQQYARRNGGIFIDIHNWRKSPYTFLKGRFLMESSSLVVYLLQDTKITANLLTIVFALLGIFGGLLLLINPVLAVIIFFFKPIFDWSDGHLAMIKNQTSEFGKHLDFYSGSIGTMSFYIGVVLGHTYLIPVIFIIYLLGKLDGRARTIDLLCLLILLKECL